MPSVLRSVLATLLNFVCVLVIAVPYPDSVSTSEIATSNDVTNAISGPAGDASGGSVFCNPGILGINGFTLANLGSNNAGNGGSSSSGDVVSQILSKARPDALKIFSRWSTNKGWDSHVTANAASGSAGDASGGDACKGGLINIDSNDAGNGGAADSGDPIARDSS